MKSVIYILSRCLGAGAGCLRGSWRGVWFFGLCFMVAGKIERQVHEM